MWPSVYLSEQRQISWIISHLPWLVRVHMSGYSGPVDVQSLAQLPELHGLSEPFASSIAFSSPAPKISWVTRSHRRLSQFPPLPACSGFSWMREAQMLRHSHARIQQLCLLQDRGQMLLNRLQWKPGRHFMFHCSLNAVKKWKCQKRLVCQWLKWFWQEGTEGRQNQNSKKMSLKALLTHHFDRFAAPC